MSDLWRSRLDQISNICQLIVLLAMIYYFAIFFATGEHFERTVILSLMYITSQQGINK